MGADPNISDTDGMYPTDLLFIGKTDVTTVKNIIITILNKQKKSKYNQSLKIHSQVFDMYYHAYRKEDEFFNKILDRLSIIKSEDQRGLDLHNPQSDEEQDEGGE